MQYSPKLKRVMQEIKDILSREDIAGHVVIHEPGYSEYLLKVDPTYSCAKIRGNRLEIKAKKDDFLGDTDRQSKVIGDTVNMVTHLCSSLCKGAGLMMNLESILKTKIDIDTDHGGDTDHTTQNN